VFLADAGSVPIPVAVCACRKRSEVFSQGINSCPSPRPTSEPVIPYYASDIITDALIEIGAVAPGETPGNEESQWAFRKYNYLLDMWAARKNFVPYSNFNTYTLTPGLSPHTHWTGTDSDLCGEATARKDCAG